MTPSVLRFAAAVGLLAALGACRLAEIVTTEAEELLVVEGVLRPELGIQRVLLHSSLVGESAGAERGAHVVVRTATGREVVFVEMQSSDACLSESSVGSLACYISRASEGNWVRAGEEYALEVVTRDGRRAFGHTRVPGVFTLLQPAGVPSGAFCRLPPDQALPLVWSRSRGAWTYLAELEISGLRDALRGRGIEEVPERLELTGLAISETDTTMLLPRDFGVFQRTEFEQPLLLALRDGLPAGVTAYLTLAAVDRNYVNAVRGGIFNPSGRVRIPSVAGGATGFFGSATARTLLIDVREGSTFRPCLTERGS